jgi:GntR family transcriptional regulator, arabinose operon transcriptional repressor
VDKNAPKYIQLKKELIEKIQKGEYRQEDFIPSEAELCRLYGISRYPVRQALDELVEEGLITRTRGRGTVVRSKAGVGQRNVQKILGIVMTNLKGGLCASILSGFEKEAGERGYLVICAFSQNLPDKEIHCIKEINKAGTDRIAVFPSDRSKLGDNINSMKENGITLVLIDRDAGISDADYTGSDNRGGAYSAIRHMAVSGYKNVVFVSQGEDVSSINERMEGYMKGVADFNLTALKHISVEEDLNSIPYELHRFYIESLKEDLMGLKKQLPLGVFAINDAVAVQCARIFENEGLTIGRDVGIIGFDNEPYAAGITTVAQNGTLIGSNAADILINKREGKTDQIHRMTIPTQLIIRASCSEKNDEL